VTGAVSKSLIEGDQRMSGYDTRVKSTSSAPGRFHLPVLFGGRIMSSPILRRPHSNDELLAVGNEASFGNDGEHITILSIIII
jgi:hypothetical protein